MSTFTTIKPFEFWTQHVLPLVYGEELSYMEVHDKIVYLLNELIKNNNQLPEYIQQIVQEYITSGTLEEVIRNVVSNFILNVKYPPNDIKPAVGDGTAIDTEAIQGCIDYASSKGGGVVYFPYGKYLTESLVLKDNVSLFGFGKYATKLVLSGGASNALVSGEVTGCSIANISLDGNAGIQVNEVDCISVVAGDFQMDNVVVTDGHNLVNIQKNGGNVELNNVEFKNGVEALLRIGGTTGTLHGDTLMFGRVSDVKGIAGVISDADGDMLTGIVTKEQFNVFAQLDGTGNYLSGVVKANTYVNGTGVGNSFDFIGSEKAENYSGKAERKAGEVSDTVSGNSNRNVSGNDVTVVEGDMNTTVHMNRSVHVEGANTFAVDGNSTESIDGNKSTTVTGITQETYIGDRIVYGNNQNENLSGKKVINAKDIILNSTNPLTYGNVKHLDEKYDYITMKDANNKEYKVLVGTDYDYSAINEYSLIFPKLQRGLDPIGSCAFIKHENKAILFDLAFATEYERYVKKSLINNGITKISGIVISHYDEDHIGDIEKLKADFDCTDTILYLPLASTRFPFTTEQLNNFKKVFSSNKIIYPNEKLTYTVDGISLWFVNCGETVVKYWDNETSTGYNDYSMVCYASFGLSTIAFLGDLEVQGQRRLLNNNLYKPSVIATVPHHMANDSGTIELAMEISPTFVYASNSNIALKKRGIRDPFCTITIINNGHLLLNSENPTDVSFCLGKYGVSINTGISTPNTCYADFTIPYTVDSSFSGEYSTGTSKHPFTSLRQAIMQCKSGAAYTINVVNLNIVPGEGAQCIMNNLRNITLNANGNEIPSFQAVGCQDITINDALLYNFNKANRNSNIRFLKCHFNNKCSFEDCVGLELITSYLDKTISTDLFSFTNCFVIIKDVIINSFTASRVFTAIRSTVNSNAGNELNIPTFDCDSYSIVRDATTLQTEEELKKIYHGNASPVIVKISKTNKYAIILNGNVSIISTEV